LFDDFVARAGAGEFVLAVDARGEVLATNQVDLAGDALPRETIAALEEREWSAEPWFAEAMSKGEARIDVFESGLVDPDAVVPKPARLHFGFAHAVRGRAALSEGRTTNVGVVIVLESWQVIQAQISDYGIRRGRERAVDLASEELYDSSYAWIWASDADTILAHDDTALVGRRVSQAPIELPHLVEAARRGRWAMYPDYEFRGERKRAAFKHGRPVDENGFGWIVGVGVDFSDIFEPIHEMTGTIAKATAAVLLLAVLVTIVVARRTTRPIQELEGFTRRVASGDLDAQVPVHGKDELGDLARSFNRMTTQLKENRAQLVKAEKDAAWREMARQVAHEIKNPLTPIQLSASLLERAHREGSPEFESILARTIDVVQRQVENMRGIARDFYRFAGEHRAPALVDAREVLEEQFALHAAWAETEGLTLRLEERSPSGHSPVVRADPDELRRAILNLVSNAIEAFALVERDGGEPVVDPAVRGDVRVEGRRVVIEIADPGPGITDDVREQLFEPYFTTRSSGTGLGLAIVRRIVEDLGGSVALDNAPSGRGAVARLELPLVESGPDAQSNGGPMGAMKTDGEGMES
ncbi:MAG: ATP-binding protein, partial [Planctomycetota bacterium]